MKPDAVKNPVAMNRTGYMYKKGRGIEKDSDEAGRWNGRARKATAEFEA